ncbi:hypothetical protein B0H11DRAFT_1918016 [Mycena galericulata]|nr:hypothetical protein B0H11DRAFT_1918016 [Mycena galericulata]
MPPPNLDPTDPAKWVILLIVALLQYIIVGGQKMPVAGHMSSGFIRDCFVEVTTITNNFKSPLLVQEIKEVGKVLRIPSPVGQLLTRCHSGARERDVQVERGEKSGGNVLLLISSRSRHVTKSKSAIKSKSKSKSRLRKLGRDFNNQKWKLSLIWSRMWSNDTR